MTIAVLDPKLQTEINRISEFNSVNKKLLEDFAYFILNDYLSPKDSRKVDQ